MNDHLSTKMQIQEEQIGDLNTRFKFQWNSVLNWNFVISFPCPWEKSKYWQGVVSRSPISSFPVGLLNWYMIGLKKSQFLMAVRNLVNTNIENWDRWYYHKKWQCFILLCLLVLSRKQFDGCQKMFRNSKRNMWSSALRHQGFPTIRFYMTSVSWRFLSGMELPTSQWLIILWTEYSTTQQYYLAKMFSVWLFCF
jgi:hypothetical protein